MELAVLNNNVCGRLNINTIIVCEHGVNCDSIYLNIVRAIEMIYPEWRVSYCVVLEENALAVIDLYTTWSKIMSFSEYSIFYRNTL